MRSGTTDVESRNWRAVSRPASDWPHREHLVQAHLTVEDVAAGDAETALQVEWRQRLALDDDRSDVGRVFFDNIQDPLGERFAKVVPVPFPQRVWRVLEKDA